MACSCAKLLASGGAMSFLPLQVFRLVQKRSISVYTFNLAGGKLRERNGLARDSLEYGPLVDLPDWSYADGRPAPLTEAQKRRKQERIEMAESIVKLLGEVDKAKEKHVERKRLKEESKKSNS